MKELLDAIYNLIAHLNRETLGVDTRNAIDRVRDAIVRIRINRPALVSTFESRKDAGH